MPGLPAYPLRPLLPGLNAIVFFVPQLFTALGSSADVSALRWKARLRVGWNARHPCSTAALQRRQLPN